MTEVVERCTHGIDLHTGSNHRTNLPHVRANLDDPDQHPNPETSGSAFFCYAFAWGINNGLLDRDKFLPVTMKAWEGLVRRVHPDGKLGFVQPVGASPKPATSDMTHEYAMGLFLLAGEEMAKLVESGIIHDEVRQKHRQWSRTQAERDATARKTEPARVYFSTNVDPTHGTCLPSGKHEMYEATTPDLGKMKKGNTDETEIEILPLGAYAVPGPHECLDRVPARVCVAVRNARARPVARSPVLQRELAA